MPQSSVDTIPKIVYLIGHSDVLNNKKFATYLNDKGVSSIYCLGAQTGLVSDKYSLAIEALERFDYLLQRYVGQPILFVYVPYNEKSTQLQNFFSTTHKLLCFPPVSDNQSPSYEQIIKRTVMLFHFTAVPGYPLPADFPSLDQCLFTLETFNQFAKAVATYLADEVAQQVFSSDSKALVRLADTLMPSDDAVMAVQRHSDAVQCALAPPKSDEAVIKYSQRLLALKEGFNYPNFPTWLPVSLAVLDAEIACLLKCYTAFTHHVKLEDNARESIKSEIAVIQTMREQCHVPESIAYDIPSAILSVHVTKIRAALYLTFLRFFEENQQLLQTVIHDQKKIAATLQKEDFEPLFNTKAFEAFSTAYPETTAALELGRFRSLYSQFFRAHRQSNLIDSNVFISKVLGAFSRDLHKGQADQEALEQSSRVYQQTLSAFTKQITHLFTLHEIMPELSQGLKDIDRLMAAEDRKWQRFFEADTRDMITATFLEQDGTPYDRATEKRIQKAQTCATLYPLPEEYSDQAKTQAYFAHKKNRGNREQCGKEFAITNSEDMTNIKKLSSLLLSIDEQLQTYNGYYNLFIQLKREAQELSSKFFETDNRVDAKTYAIHQAYLTAVEKVSTAHKKITAVQEQAQRFDQSASEILNALSAKTSVEVLLFTGKISYQGQGISMEHDHNRRAMVRLVTILHDRKRSSAFFRAYNTRRQAEMYLALLHKMDHHPEQLLGEQAGLRSQAVDYLHAHREKTPALRQHFENRFALMPYQAPRSDSNLPKSNANCSI